MAYDSYFTIPWPTVVLYHMYIVLFSLYLAVFFVFWIKNSSQLSIGYFSFLIVLCVAVLLFVIKAKTSFFLDARPTTTIEALYGQSGKHSFSLMLFITVLSWIKSPHFNDIIIYNICIGSLTCVLCYLYFSLIARNTAFGVLCALFLATSALFYQATISSEYFLIQWIFTFSLLFAFYFLNIHASHLHCALFFLSYCMLLCFKVEGYSLIGVFPLLPFMISREKRTHSPFYRYYFASGALLGVILFLLLKDVMMIHDILWASRPGRTFLTELGTLFVKEQALIGTVANISHDVQAFIIHWHNEGWYDDGQFLFYWHSFLSIINELPSECIALLIIVLGTATKRIRTFDMRIVFLLFIPIFFVCFFIHDYGFHRQEGRIHYFCQLFPLFLYAWCIVMWNLLQGFKKKWLVKICTALLILAIIFPHSTKAYSFASAYMKMIPKMKTQGYNVWYDESAILLNHSWIYEIGFVSSLIKKKQLRAVILDFDKRDPGIYDYVIKNVYPEFIYISMRHNQAETHDVLFEIGKSDVVFIIENSAVPPRMSTAIREHMKHTFARLAVLKVMQWEREVDIIGVSREGIELMRKIKGE